MKFTRAFIRVFVVLLVHLAPIWGFLVLLITGGGVLLGLLEQLPLGHGIYCAWITATTVGYGDVTPATPLARVICVCLAVVGLVNTGILGAIGINAVLVASREHLDLDAIRSQLPGSRATQDSRPGGGRWAEPDLHEQLLEEDED
jgi:voltage-gated potassium channel